MDQLLSFVFEQVKNQGLSMTMMLMAAYYFYNRQSKLEEKLEKAHAENMAYLKDDRASLIQLTEEVNDSLKRNTHVIDKLENALLKALRV
jgi:hypothetical protein